MGGDLRNAPGGESPRFTIRALRDADGANLDRIQVIKGRHDGGETHERCVSFCASKPALSYGTKVP